MEREARLSILKRAVEVLKDIGFEAEVYENYSGRGMFGKEVDGIMTDVSGVVVGFALYDAVKNLTEERDEDDEFYDPFELFNSLPIREDSMGRDSKIYY